MTTDCSASGFRFVPVRLPWRPVLVGIILAGTVASVAAAAQTPGSSLGLPAAGALGIHGGFARMERSSDGLEAGAVLDLGWIKGRSVRLQAEGAILRARLVEFIEVEDSTYRGDYLDLSAGASLVWMAGPDRIVSPYVLAGFAVHALSSTFGTLVLDRRYNTNRFGSHAGAGVRLRIGRGRAMFAEGRRIITDEADRTVVRLGGLLLLGDLRRR